MAVFAITSFLACLTTTNTGICQYYMRRSPSGPIIRVESGTCSGPWYFNGKPQGPSGQKHGFTVLYGPYRSQSLANERRESYRKDAESANGFFKWKQSDAGYNWGDFSEVYCMQDGNASQEGTPSDEAGEAMRRQSLHMLMRDFDRQCSVLQQRINIIRRNLTQSAGLSPTDRHVGAVTSFYLATLDGVQSRISQLQSLKLTLTSDNSAKCSAAWKEAIAEINQTLNGIDVPQRSSNSTSSSSDVLREIRDRDHARHSHHETTDEPEKPRSSTTSASKQVKDAWAAIEANNNRYRTQQAERERHLEKARTALESIVSTLLPRKQYANDDEEEEEDDEEYSKTSSKSAAQRAAGSATSLTDPQTERVTLEKLTNSLISRTLVSNPLTLATAAHRLADSTLLLQFELTRPSHVTVRIRQTNTEDIVVQPSREMAAGHHSVRAIVPHVSAGASLIVVLTGAGTLFTYECKISQL